ncbi:M20 family metallo-hydrolase [Thalassobaculum salexigens]|uniref:M20 family metallo-hydrolase n=1 Tax=Thalassobaculum salexigens TaxID=455360 RepID=UPI00248F08BF|nr:M20 family metallo-hydrolase [Thalassobaculum salexigens]
MPKINAERLLADLDHLRTIGGVETGVIRTALSEKDMEARRWLKKRFEEAGLEATIDGVGNVLGKTSKPGPVLLIGSHSDTQPRGGWLDGALGVVYGLEIARALSEDPETANLAVDVVSWQDEEGSFLGCLGSRSWCGVLDPEAEKAATGRDGTKLTDAIAAAGLTDVPRLTMEENRYLGYLEAHIEQGAYLEQAQQHVGVVTAIVGIRAMRFKFHGEQNHAGTTTMARRKDAATALYELAYRVNQEFPSVAGERTVWTMGRAVVQPGAASIVPGYAELDLQFRDQDESILDRFEEIAAAIADDINSRGKARVEYTRSRQPVRPSIMDDGFQKHIAVAAEATVPGKWQSMPSAAGHDPMVITAKLPCAMLFIPSIGGISHDFAEDSDRGDIAIGCQVLADAASSILQERRNG